MKKIYLLLAAALLVCCTFNLSLAQTRKKILYITQDKGTAWDANAAPVDNDAIVQMLKRDANFDVTVRVLTSAEAGAAATPVDMAPFDVVVVQESLGGASAILTPAGTLGLAKFTKPTLFNKPFALAAGRAFATGTAGGGLDASTVANPVLNMVVPSANRTNELFRGINFTDATGTINVFKTGATDNGGEATGTAVPKGFSFSNAVVVDPAVRPLAIFPATPDRSIADTGTPIFFNVIPSGTRIGSETTQARMIMLGFNFGAMNKDRGTNITNEGLTLWRNAIYSLAGLTIPTTLVTGTKPEVANAAFNLGQNYPNPSNGSTTIQFELKKASPIALEVFDITGRKVATLAEGNRLPGAYEIKVDNNLKSGVYFYRLSAEGATATRTMVVSR